MIIQLLSYAGTALGFLFLTLSIASGLYYLSELVEEHCEPTRRFLNRAIYGIIFILVLLMIFDSFPIKLTIISIVSHLIYQRNLKTFPFISLGNPMFILSCVCVVVNHYFWFQHFNNVEIPPQFKYDPSYIPRKRATFAQVSSFFGICIWFIPFALFVSLSAGDFVLPSANEEQIYSKKSDDETPKLRKKAVGLVRVVINGVREYIHSIVQLFGYQGRKKTGLAV
ncbi:hypothetical protein Kpol_1067p1 [Vanderwaltozyma polyspora DSM 70294]|uniref:Protein SVP26 n=1 Tax=Vanderwaltozyma polyspora (strain ATCC 22028 / DSM 70294 / BCRC 21397 / CBS 2163 / NBRC 10782 / NRRL Y-8283 / UCD 57-17) TaxID=436907 RepID=A7TNU6_VANPO|nr:uncharacterized protein Kpol_1067p1 [Vanderwaltozyma polyspora DSM 70294]EDO16029.1 hypothetical protein Kpol_1067p1 [Vanderwaltozyma polyspora DSM 70294]